jgi:hypothetical protein
MQKGLASLIRLRRWRLDEERRQLTDLLRAADQARDCLTALDAEIEQERTSAENDEAFFAFAAYARRANERRFAAVEATRSAEAAALAQRDVVLLCHRELRSSELAEQARHDRLKREAERRDQGAIDELAILTYTPPPKC